MKHREGIMTRGFTLCELILIVGIAAVGMALVFSAAANASVLAPTLRCLSQQRLLYVGLNAYADMNSDFFPTSSPAKYQAEWASKIAPYLGVEAKPEALAPQFVCPSDARFRMLTYGDLCKEKSSYGLNGYGVCWNSKTGRGVTRAEVRNPDMLLLADANSNLVVGYAGEGTHRIPLARHEENKAVNILLFDGSAVTKFVKLSKPADMYNEGNLPSKPYWNRMML